MYHPDVWNGVPGEGGTRLGGSEKPHGQATGKKEKGEELWSILP